MTKEDYIRLGFKEVEHFTVAGNLIYDLGRRRILSAGCVGTPNEHIFICEIDSKIPEKVNDLICVHNYDYDDYVTEEKLTMLIKALSGGVAMDNRAKAENYVLHDVSAPFKTEEECIGFIIKNTPFAIAPTRKAKTRLINPFTSHNAFLKVTEVIGKAVFNVL